MTKVPITFFKNNSVTDKEPELNFNTLSTSPVAKLFLPVTTLPSNSDSSSKLSNLKVLSATH